MTGRELILWILQNEAENTKFEVQYRDGGGDYSGTDERLYLIKEIGKDENGYCYSRVIL